jgi:predicted alpha/beta hydrolase
VFVFSFDQMALLDLPAMITYVTRTAGVKQVHYLGHSQGTVMGFAGFSSNHTLASMVKQFYALAPVAKVGHIESPIRLLSPLASNVEVSVHYFITALFTDTV